MYRNVSIALFKNISVKISSGKWPDKEILPGRLSKACLQADRKTHTHTHTHSKTSDTHAHTQTNITLI